MNRDDSFSRFPRTFSCWRVAALYYSRQNDCIDFLLGYKVKNRRKKERNGNRWEMYVIREKRSRVEEIVYNGRGKKEEHERASTRAAAAGNKRGSKNQRMHSVRCVRDCEIGTEREKEKRKERNRESHGK